MNVNLRKIDGPWVHGWVLDKHTLKSTYLGDDAYGHPQYETVRTEVGQATYLLKYKQDWAQAGLLAQTLAENICPMLQSIGFIVPMPASKVRPRQPVNEVAVALGKILNIPVFEQLLVKAPTGQSLKDLGSKSEKVAAIGNSLSINDQISNQGKWNVLLIDDLFDTGASMEAACNTMRNYPKAGNIYVAALTWK